MTSSKPSIVVVHGAWHASSHFAPTATLLESAGYTVHAVSLPSSGASPSLQNFDPDVAAVRSVIEDAIGTGNSVVVVMHSYGGFPTSDAVYGLDAEARRAEGLKGGVVRLVYLAAFCMNQGVSLNDARAAPLPDWVSHDKEADTLTVITPLEVFYADVPADLAAASAAALRPQSYGVFASKLARQPPWKRIPTTYIICEEDLALPTAAQEAMVAANREDPECKIDVVERVKSSHSPFLSRPGWTSKAIRRACGEDVQGGVGEGDKAVEFAAMI